MLLKSKRHNENVLFSLGHSINKIELLFLDNTAYIESRA